MTTLVTQDETGITTYFFQTVGPSFVVESEHVSTSELLQEKMKTTKNKEEKKSLQLQIKLLKYD